MKKFLIVEEKNAITYSYMFNTYQECAEFLYKLTAFNTKVTIFKYNLSVLSYDFHSSATVNESNAIDIDKIIDTFKLYNECYKITKNKETEGLIYKTYAEAENILYSLRYNDKRNTYNLLKIKETK